MKKLTALILAVAMALSFAACGGGGADSKAQEAEIIARAEEIGRISGSHVFNSSEHIKQILVIVPKEEGGFHDAFEPAAGALEFYSGASETGRVEGIVIYCTSSDMSSEKQFGSVSYLGVSAMGEEDETGEAASEREYALNGLDLFGAVPVAEESASPLTSIEYCGYKLNFLDNKTGLDGLKWLLANYSLDFDNWLAEKGETFADVITAGDAVKDAAGEDYRFNADYINYCGANKEYKEYEARRHTVEYIQLMVSSLEAIDISGMSENEVNAAYHKAVSEIEQANEFETALQTLYDSRATFVSQLEALESTALAELEALSAEIEEIKKDNEDTDYKDDDRYWKIKLENTIIGRYEDLLESIALLDRSIDTMYEVYLEPDSSLANLLENYSADDADLYVEYYQSRAAYVTAVMAYEKYLADNAAAIEAFNTAVDAIKDKYTDDSYKSDVDYMKLEIQYADLIQQTAQLEKNVETAKEKTESVRAEREERKEKYEADVESRNMTILINRDQSKIREYFESWKEELLPLKNDGGAGESSRIVLEKDGFVVIALSSAIVDAVDGAREVWVSNSGGGGGGGKTCAEPGCTRSAALSGDSVYCTTHSAKCLNCGCYIDKDAMYCMDCLRAALS